MDLIAQVEDLVHTAAAAAGVRLIRGLQLSWLLGDVHQH